MHNLNNVVVSVKYSQLHYHEMYEYSRKHQTLLQFDGFILAVISSKASDQVVCCKCKHDLIFFHSCHINEYTAI
jgi:hypothetical protein